ncbi:hypothetical protein HKX48_005241 [Thoreauomyces humboldtii]|nr:hypothetical protein HKX48_005241 [Thoreauomyces humboldtii]
MSQSYSQMDPFQSVQQQQQQQDHPAPPFPVIRRMSMSQPRPPKYVASYGPARTFPVHDEARIEAEVAARLRDHAAAARTGTYDGNYKPYVPDRRPSSGAPQSVLIDRKKHEMQLLQQQQQRQQHLQDVVLVADGEQRDGQGQGQGQTSRHGGRADGKTGVPYDSATGTGIYTARRPSYRQLSQANYYVPPYPTPQYLVTPTAPAADVPSYRRMSTNSVHQQHPQQQQQQHATPASRRSSTLSTAASFNPIRRDSKPSSSSSSSAVIRKAGNVVTPATTTTAVTPRRSTAALSAGPPTTTTPSSSSAATPTKPPTAVVVETRHVPVEDLEVTETPTSWRITARFPGFETRDLFALLVRGDAPAVAAASSSSSPVVTEPDDNDRRSTSSIPPVFGRQGDLITHAAVYLECYHIETTVLVPTTTLPPTTTTTTVTTGGEKTTTHQTPQRKMVYSSTATVPLGGCPVSFGAMRTGEMVDGRVEVLVMKG